MAIKAEGIFPCTVLFANYGEDPRRAGVTGVQISVKIDDGPDKGACCTYEDEVTHKSALYITRSCQAIGWKGGPGGDDLNTLKADVDAWVKATGGKSTVEIKHLLIKTGKNAGKTWDKVNSIGRGPKPLRAATGEAHSDAREAVRAAMALDGSSMPPPDHDVPPPDDDDDIPF